MRKLGFAKALSKFDTLARSAGVDRLDAYASFGQIDVSHTAACEMAISKALSWVTGHLEEFDPFSRGGAFDLKHGQRVAELATMLYCYAVLAETPDPLAVRQIVTLLERVQGNRAFGDRIERAPKELALYVNVYSVLRQLGYDSVAIREQIQRALEAGLANQAERLPYQKMELLLSLERGEFSVDWSTWEDLGRSSILAQTPDALYLDEETIYALTHDIMFLNGFGTKRRVLPSWSDGISLRQTLSRLIVRVSQERHWDLLGELLLCWDCLGFDQTTIIERGWTAFLAIQQDDGSFLGPERTETRKRLQADDQKVQERQEWDFAYRYHTTLVAVIACSLHSWRSNHDASAVSAEHKTTVDRTSAGAPVNDLMPAVYQALNWLNALLDTSLADGTAHPTALCNILLGMWLCCSVTRVGADEVSKTARLIAQVLMEQAKPADNSLSQAPPSLRLMVAAILSTEGIAVPPLHDYWQMVEQALNANPETNARNDVHFTEKRVLLHALHHHGAPALVDSTSVVELARVLPLTASPQEVDALLLRIFSHTGYGTRRSTHLPVNEWLKELLLGLATHSFRHYNIEEGCRHLRAALYLNDSADRQFESFTKFLRLHQRPEGAFGFFGPEETELAARMPESFSLKLDLYLPTTITCLWTLVEMGNADWRLFEAIGLPSNAGNVQPRDLVATSKM